MQRKIETAACTKSECGLVGLDIPELPSNRMCGSAFPYIIIILGPCVLTTQSYEIWHNDSLIIMESE